MRGDVGALVADRRDDTEDDVVDRVGVEVGLRFGSSSSRPVSSEIGLTSCREPVFLPRPRGVRMAS